MKDTPNPAAAAVEKIVSTAKLRDCKGREIMVGDVLKVFHFIGPGRKHNWMYKQVIEKTTVGKTNPIPAFKVAHLNLNPNSYYWELINGRTLASVEIVQGFGPTDDLENDFRNRERLLP